MDKDRIKGSAQQAKGKVKEVAGKVTGDAKLESEGKADKAAGIKDTQISLLPRGVRRVPAAWQSETVIEQ
jgi:hypothetical protein